MVGNYVKLTAPATWAPACNRMCRHCIPERLRPQRLCRRILQNEKKNREASAIRIPPDRLPDDDPADEDHYKGLQPPGTRGAHAADN